MITGKHSDQLRRLVATLFLLAIVGWQIFLLGIVIMILLPKSIDWGATWENLENFTGTVEHVITVITLILGGFFTYYKFIKGRVFISRLEPEVSGEIISLYNTNYLRISVELKNVGSSKVEITNDGVSLDIFAEKSRHTVPAEDAQKRKVRSVNWDALWPFDILGRHAWIEPGETIRDQVLIELLTNENIAYKVDLVIFASGTRWTATSVVLPKLRRKTALVGKGHSSKEADHG